MPYKHAHWWMVLVAAITVIGFWPSYFMELRAAPLAFHAHAISSLAWVALVGVQSWSIHRGHRSAHKTTGKLSFVLFPLLMASFVGIINVSAGRFQAGDEPFMQTYAPMFGWAMSIALLAYLVLYAQALRHRRNLWWHAGFMLTTPLILWESPFSRVVEIWVPGQQVAGPENFHLVGYQITGSMLMAALFALGVWFLHRRRAMPFLVAAALILVQAVGFYVVGGSAWWREAFAVYAQVPAAVTIGGGLAVGMLTAWIGWRYPASPAPPRHASGTTATPGARV